MIGLLLASLAVAEEPVTSLFVDVDLVDVPEALTGGLHVPTMGQSLQVSAGLLDLSFFAIDSAGNALVDPVAHPLTNTLIEQPVAALWVHFGRELPIPLMVWSHEAFHQAALRDGGVTSRNGNQIGNRWNGTVYDVRDAELVALKAEAPAGLTRALSAGVEAHVALNRYVTFTDFRWRRSIPRAVLLLDNAWYMWSYFHLAASPEADIVKTVILEHGGDTQADRDFAGNDLTAWTRDLWRPDEPYTARGPHPDGTGLARPVGWSDLSREEQVFLRRQRDLSLLNFANPQAFGVRRFRVGEVAFLPFVQYTPASFGSLVDLTTLVDIAGTTGAVSLRGHLSRDRIDPGLELAGVDVPLTLGGTTLLASPQASAWLQPRDQRFDGAPVVGGGAGLRIAGPAGDRGLWWTAGLSWRSDGFVLGDARLDGGVTATAGLRAQPTRSRRI